MHLVEERRGAQKAGTAVRLAVGGVRRQCLRLWSWDEYRFEGVAAIGVDEHVWRHARRGGKYVTVIIDLTPVREGSGPARLLEPHSRPGSPSVPRYGAMPWRWSRWTGSRASRPQPPGRLPRSGGHGPLPRRPLGGRRSGPVPAASPARRPRPPWFQGRSALYKSRHTLHTDSRPSSSTTATSTSKRHGASTSGWRSTAVFKEPDSRTEYPRNPAIHSFNRWPSGPSKSACLTKLGLANWS
jgi:hypothetical protein